MANILTKIAKDLAGDVDLSFRKRWHQVRQTLSHSRALWAEVKDGALRVGAFPWRLAEDPYEPTGIRERAGVEVSLRVRPKIRPGVGLTLPGGWNRDSDAYLFGALPFFGQFEVWLSYTDPNKPSSRKSTRCYEFRVGRLGEDVEVTVNLGGTWRSMHGVRSYCVDPRRWLFGPIVTVKLSEVATDVEVPLPDRCYRGRAEIGRFRRVRHRLLGFASAGRYYTSGSVSCWEDPIPVGGKAGAIREAGTRALTAAEAVGELVGRVLRERQKNEWTPSDPPSVPFIPLWDAVERHVAACGGDPKAVLPSLETVTAIERAVSRLMPKHRLPVPEKDPERAEHLARCDKPLVESVLRNLKSRRPTTTTLRAVVIDTFACGSRVAEALCRRFGRDPDEAVPGLMDDSGSCSVCGNTTCPECETVSAEDYCRECFAVCELCGNKTPREGATPTTGDDEDTYWLCPSCAKDAPKVEATATAVPPPAFTCGCTDEKKCAEHAPPEDPLYKAICAIIRHAVLTGTDTTHGFEVNIPDAGIARMSLHVERVDLTPTAADAVCCARCGVNQSPDKAVQGPHGEVFCSDACATEALCGGGP